MQINYELLNSLKSKYATDIPVCSKEHKRLYSSACDCYTEDCGDDADCCDCAQDCPGDCTCDCALPD